MQGDSGGGGQLHHLPKHFTKGLFQWIRISRSCFWDAFKDERARCALRAAANDQFSIFFFLAHTRHCFEYSFDGFWTCFWTFRFFSLMQNGYYVTKSVNGRWHSFIWGNSIIMGRNILTFLFSELLSSSLSLSCLHGTVFPTQTLREMQCEQIKAVCERTKLRLFVVGCNRSFRAQ